MPKRRETATSDDKVNEAANAFMDGDVKFPDIADQEVCFRCGQWQAKGRVERFSLGLTPCQACDQTTHVVPDEVYRALLERRTGYELLHYVARLRCILEPRGDESWGQFDMRLRIRLDRYEDWPTPPSGT